MAKTDILQHPGNAISSSIPPASPVDDCCPICFDHFTLPCRSNCDHWFCASCILEFWRYGASLKPCKCPFCARRIRSLSPQLTLLSPEDSAAVSILKNVDIYNSLYVGGASGLMMKALTLPSYIRRCLLQMSDPARQDYYYSIVCGVALFLSIIYMACSFNFTPKAKVYWIICM